LARLLWPASSHSLLFFFARLALWNTQPFSGLCCFLFCCCIFVGRYVHCCRCRGLPAWPGRSSWRRSLAEGASTKSDCGSPLPPATWLPYGLAIEGRAAWGLLTTFSQFPRPALGPVRSIAWESEFLRPGLCLRIGRFARLTRVRYQARRQS